MIDRGIIKWQPFDSCFSSNKVLKEIKNNKEKMIFPILSPDQLNYLEEKIMDAYHLREIIIIDYYYDGKIYNIKGIIKEINLQSKMIYINNKIIYFKQILNIN